MTDTPLPRKHDDADERHDRQQDDRAERISGFSLTQLECAIAVAEAYYDWSLTNRARDVNAALVRTTDDADAWKAAKAELVRLDRKTVDGYTRLAKAAEAWARERPRP